MGRAAALISVLAIASACALLGAGAGACGPRAQLIVVIDTDVPLPAQVAADRKAFAPAATFDRLRIEMVKPGEEFSGVSGVAGNFEQYFQEISITPSTVWPLSFGVQEGEDGRTARMRIRAYRSENIDTAFELVLDPTKRLAIDRLATADVPSSGVETVRIVLHGDCLGHPPDFALETTCVADPADFKGPREGVELLGEDAKVPPTVAGSWAPGRATACDAPPPMLDAGQNPTPADAICVPGGISLRGDLGFEDVGFVEGYLSSGPRHLVQLPAFYIDRTEMTVLRFRRVATKLDLADLPYEQSKNNPSCTWTAKPGPNESLPINCMSAASALSVCMAEHGDLPTDAQWEHAARGRGAVTPYVWGATGPACCAARIGSPLGCNIGGVSSVGLGFGQQAGEGPLAPGSFIDPAKCEGRADVSVDGVLDLAGNLREVTIDAALNYDDEDCPLPKDGIALEPVCARTQKRKAARGGSFRSTFDGAKIAARTIASISDDVGFRCAYRGTP